MAQFQRNFSERDFEQAISTLKKGMYLLKYGRWGKPKFCPFRLSNAIFQRSPQPDKNNNHFLFFITTDPWIWDEAELWFTALRVLISEGYQRYPKGFTLTRELSTEKTGKSFFRGFTYTSIINCLTQTEPVARHANSLSLGGLENSSVDSFRSSLSSNKSSLEDFNAIGGVFIWGEGAVLLDARNISCGNKHVVLVTKQGQIFSWGEGTGGRLGHGVEADVYQPRLIGALSGSSIGLVACGEFHTCAVTHSGDLYTWGDGSYNLGLLGHGTEVSKWIPRKVRGDMQGMQVSHISCGAWHTAVVKSTGKLFTFGDGTFGALGHGDRKNTSLPREVEALRGLRTLRASCGVWHTAAVAEVLSELSAEFSSGKLFTWVMGRKGSLDMVIKNPD
ncbi:Ran GTPase binding protein, putative isoform 2 [Hibiscus syriacus]|uniref:Ran GTPase binding protein, putative isoform 2 n=1 Tax=Hibiscus syriacus TaxID=106335 RepID=A0A6A2WVW4_HIBSY|nr:Ran GTPase binding protein, putative isoform 2 [Hibiscus syriacus]